MICRLFNYKALSNRLLQAAEEGHHETFWGGGRAKTKELAKAVMERKPKGEIFVSDIYETSLERGITVNKLLDQMLPKRG